MVKDSLISIFQRDLIKLKEEINFFNNISNLWQASGDIKNSPGNLKHFIGHLLGGTDYLRNREKEFLLRDVEKEELLKSIDETIEIIKLTLKNLIPILSIKNTLLIF